MTMLRLVTDPVNGMLERAAIAARSGPRPAGSALTADGSRVSLRDERSSGQRRAEACVELLLAGAGLRPVPAPRDTDTDTDAAADGSADGPEPGAPEAAAPEGDAPEAASGTGVPMPEALPSLWLPSQGPMAEVLIVATSTRWPPTAWWGGGRSRRPGADVLGGAGFWRSGGRWRA